MATPGRFLIGMPVPEPEPEPILEDSCAGGMILAGVILLLIIVGYVIAAFIVDGRIP